MPAVSYVPGQPVAKVHASLCNSLKALENAQQCAVLWFAEVMKRVAKEGGFYLLPLPSADRDFFEASVVGIDGKRNLVNLRARLVAQCWCFEDASMVGNPKTVGSFRADVLGQLFDRVRHLNGMDAEDIEEAGKD